MINWIALPFVDGKRFLGSGMLTAAGVGSRHGKFFFLSQVIQLLELLEVLLHAKDRTCYPGVVYYSRSARNKDILIVC